MKPRKIPSFFFVVIVTLLVTAPLGAQIVQQVIVSKTSEWIQTSADTPSTHPFIDPSPIGPNYGGPYSFGVQVSGTNLSGIPAPVVTLPAGSLYPTQNPTRHNGGALAYSVNNQEWDYGVDANQYGASTESARDAAFAPGTYGMSANGTSFNLNFPADTFPENTPTVTLTGGTWVRGTYMIDVTQPLTITTNAFTNFNQNADGAITLNVDGVTNQLVFYSDNHAASNFLTYTIPANTLVAGTEYSAQAGFYAIMDKSTAIAGSLNIAAYGRNTHFRIAAYSGTLPSATLHGIGDLPGGIVSSEVRDVARVSNVLYAVGSASGNSGLPAGRDTAVIWTTTGGLMPLPNLVTNTVATSFVTASAITPDAAYIASRARSTTSGGAFQAVRVTTSTRAILNFTGLVGTGNSVANAISSDGSILYGFANNPTQVAVRYTASGPTGTQIPFLNAGDNQSGPAPRGCSADGSVMVGTSINTTTGHQGAFRYLQGTGVSAMPYLAGGTWNASLAVSPDGNLALLTGNSSGAPQGEFYLYNATSHAVTALGTPNGSRAANGTAGMTSDGSVVVANLNDLNTVNGVTTGSSASYVHNSHGWHNLQAVVAASGVNLTGWTLDPVAGISSDGTLVWGMGTHNGGTEGFVVEFAPGFLAAYNEPATYSTPNQAIVGAWTSGDTTSSTSGAAVVIFYANGYYMHIQIPNAADAGSGVAGFERGQYTWDANTGLLRTTTLLDTNGDIGLSGNDGGPGIPVTISGNTATATTDAGLVTLTRVAGTSPLVGAFGDATVADHSGAFVFLPNGYFYYVQDGDSTPAGDPSGHDGMEWGTYTWDSTTHNFVANVLVDTNGQWGMSHPGGPQSIVLSGNLLTLTLTNVSGVYPIPRVIGNPGIPIQPASQTIVTGNAVTFTATVSGSPTPTYQWQKNGVNIAGATTATYTIAAVSASDAGSYTVVVTNSGGSTTSNAAVLTIVPFHPSDGMADFNNDGRPDLLWQNTLTGQRSIWLMNGLTATGGADLGTVPVEWVIAGTADFTGDGKTDLLWQNTVTGQRSVWAMNGTTALYGVDLGTVSLDWWIAGIGDFNGDGKPDILWTNTVTNERAIWLMNGTTAISGVSLGIIPFEWTIAGAADFNLDGKTDILWSNVLTGERSIWLMNGTTATAGISLGIFTPRLQISGTGDYNGDGSIDILLSDQVSGARSVWLMNGTSIASTVSLGTVSPDWILNRPVPRRVPVDFNADNKSDIVWQNTVTGERAAWLMNGTTALSGISLGSRSTDWEIAATGDFNFDGRADLVWQNTATGERNIWLMNGATKLSEVALPTIPVDWKFRATGDFNLDGAVDLVLQNTTTGECVVWFMSGATPTGGVSLGIQPLTMQIVGCGDFNADSKADIVWTNTSTGERSIWLMNGTTMDSSASLGVVPLQWAIAGTGDFDQDGNADLVWQNTATGERSIWLMNGTSPRTGVSLGTAPTSWSIRN